MRSLQGFRILALAGAFAAASAAQAAVVSFTDIDLSAGAFTYSPVAGTSFTLRYAPSGSFDFEPVFLTTTGTAQATAFGGFLGIPLEPSTFFTSANVEVGPSIFPGFGAFPVETAVPFSISPGDLGLRYMVGSDSFYGYARFGGAQLTAFAFETDANTPIRAGTLATAVPEPATWAMLLLGFGAIGASLRSARPVLVPARA